MFIPFTEPVSPRYIFINPKTNKVHLLVPVIGGEEISTDNTCQSTVAVFDFFKPEGVLNELNAYKAALEYDLQLLDETSPLKTSKEERLVQINEYIKTVPLMQEKSSEALKSVLEKPSNLYSMQLKPFKPDLSSHVNNPVFTVTREVDLQTGDPLSTLYNALNTVFPNTTIAAVDPQQKLKNAVMGELAGKKVDLPAIQDCLKQKCLELFNINVDFTKDQTGRTLNQHYLDAIIGSSDDEPATTEDYVNALIGSCAPNIWISIHTTPYQRVKNDENKAEELSILTQFFLALVNIYCVSNKISTSNFGTILDNSPELSAKVAAVVSHELSTDGLVEEGLCSFINKHNDAFAMKCTLTRTDLDLIKQKFDRTYTTVTATKENPHMDDFMILDTTAEKGAFITHQGSICTDFSEFIDSSLDNAYFQDIRKDFYTLQRPVFPPSNDHLQAKPTRKVEQLNDTQLTTLLEKLSKKARTPIIEAYPGRIANLISQKLMPASYLKLDSFMNLTAEEISAFCNDPLIKDHLISSLKINELNAIALKKDPDKLKAFFNSLGLEIARNVVIIPADLESLIKQLTAERTQIVCEPMKQHLALFFSTGYAVKNIFNQIDTTQRIPLLTVIKNFLNFDTFKTILSILEPEQRKGIYDLMGEQIPALITSYHLFDQLVELYPEQHIDIYNVMKDKLPKLTMNPYQFIATLKLLLLKPKDQLAFIISVTEQLPNFVKDSFNLRLIFEATSPENHFSFINLVKDFLDYDGLKSALTILEPDQRIVIYKTINERQPKIINTVKKLNELLELYPEETGVIFEVMHDCLPSIIEHFFQYENLIKQYPLQRSIINEVMKDKIPKLITEDYQLVQALSFVKPGQQISLIETIHNSLPQILATTTRMKDIVQLLDSDNRIPVLKILKNSLNFNNFHEIYTTLNPTQQSIAYDLMKDKLPTLIKTRAHFNTCLEILEPEHRMPFIESIQESLEQLIDTDSNTLQIFTLTGSEHVVPLLILMQKHIPGFLNNGYQLREIIEINPDQSDAICEVVKDRLPKIINDKDGLIFTMKARKPEHRLALLEALKTQLPDIIKDENDLKDILNTLGDDELTQAYEVLKEHLPQIITSNSQLISILEPLNSEQRTIVYEVMKSSLLNLITSAYEYNNLLKLLSATQRTETCELLKNQLPQITQEYYDLHFIFEVLDPQYRLAYCEAIKNKLPQIMAGNPNQAVFLQDLKPEELNVFRDQLPLLINDANEFSAIFKLLDPVQQIRIYEAIKNRLPQFITDSLSFYVVFEVLNPLQRSFTFEIIKNDLAQYINNANDFSYVCGSLEPPQISFIFEAVKDRLPELFSEPEDIFMIFPMLNQEQCSYVYEVTKDLLADLITDKTVFEYLLTTLNEAQGVELSQKVNPEFLKTDNSVSLAGANSFFKAATIDSDDEDNNYTIGKKNQ